MTFNVIARLNKLDPTKKIQIIISELKIKGNFGRKMVIADPHLNAQNKYLIEQTPEV